MIVNCLIVLRPLLIYSMLGTDALAINGKRAFVDTDTRFHIQPKNGR
jgi:hypothetical protein